MKLLKPFCRDDNINTGSFSSCKQRSLHVIETVLLSHYCRTESTDCQSKILKKENARNIATELTAMCSEYQYHGWLKSTDDYIKICAVMLLSGSLTIIKLAKKKKKKEVVGIKCSPLKMDDHVIGLRYQMTALHNYCRSKHQHNNIQPHTSQHSYPSAA